VRFLVVLFLAALLLGCSSTAVRLSEHEQEKVWQNQLHLLEASPHWSLRGRVAIQAEDEGWNANLSWTKSEQSQRIQLTGPLGGGVVSLQQDTNGAVLIDSRGNKYSDQNAERLLQQVTGWQLPVEGLQYWVRGQAIPKKAASLELNEQGLLKRLKQNDWDIRYLAYKPHGFLQLPKTIFMSRQMTDGSSRTLEIRLALNKWQSLE